MPQETEITQSNPDLICSDEVTLAHLHLIMHRVEIRLNKILTPEVEAMISQYVKTRRMFANLGKRQP